MLSFITVKRLTPEPSEHGKLNLCIIFVYHNFILFSRQSCKRGKICLSGNGHITVRNSMYSRDIHDKYCQGSARLIRNKATECIEQYISMISPQLCWYHLDEKKRYDMRVNPPPFLAQNFERMDEYDPFFRL